MEELSNLMGIQQHFTCAYAPWANGTVERLNREVKLLFTKLTQELRLPQKKWPQLVPLVVSALNNTPSTTRGGLAPVTSFLGEPAQTPLSHVLGNDRAIDWTKGDVAAATASLRLRLDENHKVILLKDGRSTSRHARGGSAPPFIVGDYVMCTDKRKRYSKITATKLGPYLVTGTDSDWVFQIKHLANDKVIRAHAERLEFYSDKSLNVSEELREQLRFQLESYDVERLMDVRYNRRLRGYEVLTRWHGFQEADDSWEPLEEMAASVPALVRRLRDASRISAQAKSAIDSALSS